MNLLKKKRLNCLKWLLLKNKNPYDLEIEEIVASNQLNDLEIEEIEVSDILIFAASKHFFKLNKLSITTLQKDELELLVKFPVLKKLEIKTLGE